MKSVCADRAELVPRLGQQHASIWLRAVLAEIGSVEPVTTSYDGSAVSYLVAAKPDFQPYRIIEQLKSPQSGRPSPLKTLDKALVLSLECAAATRMERVTDWLRENGCLSER